MNQFLSKELSMNIRQATKKDLISLMPIFEEARRTIAALGINQWQEGYPNKTVISEDIAIGRSYCAENEEGKVCASFALLDDGEPTYDVITNGAWQTGDRKTGYLAIHRVAIAVASRGQGIAPAMLTFAQDYAKKRGLTSLRIDTHEGNIVMRRMLEKNGFSLCGVIFLQNGDPRVAYERLV
jgi:ribosomal protein S18 acetylase RimI-like enzyme